MNLLVLFAVLTAAGFATVASAVGGRGFGDRYKWFTVEEGLQQAAATDKPAMVVIHKSWCGACKRLGPLFAESSELLKLSEEFVMINVHDDEEPAAPQYKPYGGYVPRILFFEPNGDVRDDIINRDGNPQYKYFYTSAENVVSGMKNALGLLKPK